MYLMKKGTRRLLFYMSFALFIVAGYFLVLYAFGYKYDFADAKFIKTGSFEIKTESGVEMYVDDQLSGQTSFLNSSLVKNRLIPGDYFVQLQKPGFQQWQKYVTITEGLLTEVDNVILLPEKFDEAVVATSSFSTISKVKFNETENTVTVYGKTDKNIETISLLDGVRPTPKVSAQNKPTLSPSMSPIPDLTGVSPDGNKKLTIDNNEIWVSWLNDSNHQPFMSAGDKISVTKFSQPIGDAQWYKDSEHLILGVGFPGQPQTIKFVEIDNRGGINVYTITSATGPFFYSRSTDRLYVFRGNNLVAIKIK